MNSAKDKHTWSHAPAGAPIHPSRPHVLMQSRLEFTAKKIMVLLHGGLCNRLLPALSALYIGHKLNIPVYFDWRVTPGCACALEQLFKPKINQTPLTDPYLYHRDEQPETKQTLLTMLRTEPELRVRSPIPFEVFHDLHPGEAPAWMAANLSVYFDPVDELSERIRAYAEEHPVAAAVGVHVRRGDKQGRVRNLPKIGQYFEAIDPLLQPAMPLFLTTDDGCSAADSPVIRAFHQRYGERVMCAQKDSIRRDVAGMQAAVVDLWLLRTCTAIVGTKCSTFSQAAALGKAAMLV